MGLSGISPGSLLLIFLITLLLFGTKKLRHIGSDLGHAFREFKNAFEGKTTQEAISKESPEKSSDESQRQG